MNGFPLWLFFVFQKLQKYDKIYLDFLDSKIKTKICLEESLEKLFRIF